MCFDNAEKSEINGTEGIGLVTPIHDPLDGIGLKLPYESLGWHNYRCYQTWPISAQGTY